MKRIDSRHDTSPPMRALLRAARSRSSLPPSPPLLADHDAGSLAELLVAAGGAPSAARSAAGRVLRHVFRAGAASWDAVALASLEIGAWAREALLALDPVVSLEVAEVVH